MFFILSKIFEVVAAPVNFALLAGALGVALSFTRRARLGRLIGGGVLLFLLILGFTPLPSLLAVPLEERFPAPPEDASAPAGVIILGGAVNEELSAIRHSVTLNDAAERIVEAIALKSRYPKARFIFSGGSAALFGSEHSEADTIARFWRETGVDRGDIVYENRSRNTLENAIYTRDLAKPRDGERWLLVTSAMHMPRAVGVFRKAGFDVVAWPVDYRTSGDPWRVNFRSASTNFALAENAFHEWVGLLAYRLTGKTGALFPGP